jgi:hypothetical protein
LLLAQRVQQVTAFDDKAVLGSAKLTA